MPWDGVGSMNVPRLKLVIHRAEMSPHGSWGLGRGGAPIIDDLRRFPPVRVAPEPIPHCIHSGGEPVEERYAAGQRLQHDRAKAQAGETEGCNHRAEMSLHSSLGSRRSLPIRFASEPIPHCIHSGGERVEERCAAGRRLQHDCAKAQAGETEG